MRRPGPRPIGNALHGALASAAPAGLLARVQAVWPEVAGPVVAAAADPTSERDGVVTVACGSSVWAQELELLAGELAGRLNEALGDGGAVAELRFRAGPRPAP